MRENLWAQHESLLFYCCCPTARVLSEKRQSRHITSTPFQALKDNHLITFRIKPRLPPITCQEQHDLITLSDLIPDILRPPLQLNLLHTLWPWLILTAGPSSLCLKHCSPLQVPPRLALLLKQASAQTTPTQRGLPSPWKSKTITVPLHHCPVPSLALFLP